MPGAVDDVVATMQSRLDGLTPAQQPLREFLGTYQRTTLAVGAAVEEGLFEDPAWVEQWDVAFAELYLTPSTCTCPAVRRRVPGGSPSTHRPTCPRYGWCCSASTRTSTTTCPRPCSR